MVIIALRAAGINLGKATVKPSKRVVMRLVAPIIRLSTFSGESNVSQSVSTIDKAPSTNNGAFSTSPFTRAIMSSIANGIRTGKSNATELVRDSNRDAKPEINESAFSEIASANCYIIVPARAIN